MVHKKDILVQAFGLQKGNRLNTDWAGRGGSYEPTLGRVGLAGLARGNPGPAYQLGPMACPVVQEYPTAEVSWTRLRGLDNDSAECKAILKVLCANERSKTDATQNGAPGNDLTFEMSLQCHALRRSSVVGRSDVTCDI